MTPVLVIWEQEDPETKTHALEDNTAPKLAAASQLAIWTSLCTRGEDGRCHGVGVQEPGGEAFLWVSASHSWELNHL